MELQRLAPGVGGPNLGRHRCSASRMLLAGGRRCPLLGRVWMYKFGTSILGCWVMLEADTYSLARHAMQPSRCRPMMALVGFVSMVIGVEDRARRNPMWLRTTMTPAGTVTFLKASSSLYSFHPVMRTRGNPRSICWMRQWQHFTVVPTLEALSRLFRKC
jgi:hypothetical protein